MRTLLILVLGFYFVGEVFADSCQEALSLDRLIAAPETINPDVEYVTNHAYLNVVFSSEAIDDLLSVDRKTSQKLLRAIRKGFVAPRSGSGIVRVPYIHRSFVEIKAIPSISRLLGCLDGRVLVIKRLIEKRNEGGHLSAYRALCG
jgi:hypothetical protein